MAKCIQCGRKGLFFRVNGEGLCASCAEIKAQKRALDEKQRKVDEEINLLKPQLEHLRSENAAMQEQLAATEKKLQTAQNRILKCKSTFQSMQYAMETYMNPRADRSQIAPLLKVDLAEILGEEPELKCLTMKSLRSLYRQNEKQILQVTESYQSQYTTKANAAIYKLMVLALHSELTVIMQGLSYGKLDDAVDKVKTLTARYHTIAADGNQTIVNTLNRFIGQIESLYIEAVKIEYEYYVQRERAKEEQRAIREQMRQEMAEKKQLEAERKKIEAEEKKYHIEMARVRDQLTVKVENDEEKEMLRKRLEELEAQLHAVGEQKDEITALQNGKAGTIYIISNIGSFGDSVFKIGMTRRLEPQERVDELGDASVPFPFDVHSFIFSDDAVSLENELHKRLNAQRVNKVNLRKEFFHVSLDELEKLVEEVDPSAAFERTMLAEQYRQSLSIDAPTEEYVDLDVE